jgi:hypothetical protein
VEGGSRRPPGRTAPEAPRNGKPPNRGKLKPIAAGCDCHAEIGDRIIRFRAGDHRHFIHGKRYDAHFVQFQLMQVPDSVRNRVAYNVEANAQALQRAFIHQSIGFLRFARLHHQFAGDLESYKSVLAVRNLVSAPSSGGGI